MTIYSHPPAGEVVEFALSQVMLGDPRWSAALCVFQDQVLGGTRSGHCATEGLHSEAGVIWYRRAAGSAIATRAGPRRRAA